MENRKDIIELRPHHVLGLMLHEAYPEFYSLSDAEYISRFRAKKGNFHSGDLILCYRDTLRRLHENPDMKFKYVRSADSVCTNCEHIKNCHSPMHPNYSLVESADKSAVEMLKELEFDKEYDLNLLRRIINVSA